jgi:hypothetical protein
MRTLRNKTQLLSATFWPISKSNNWHSSAQLIDQRLVASSDFQRALDF